MTAERSNVVAVAYSGGRDSTALLHATLAASDDVGCTVVALHVDHGLHPHAVAWSAHCEAQCAAWSTVDRPLRFACDRLGGRPPRGASVEAWAREGRYAVLRELASSVGASAVLLGHHRRDQAETFLLQALRGAGVAGLASMPRVVTRNGIAWLRPWLDLSREDIDAYVARHGLNVVDDDSNDDVRFARNRLRREMWPAFVASFPQLEAALVRSAAWAAEAAMVLDEVAAQDLLAVVQANRLDLAAWRTLSPPRRGLVLRTWLKSGCGVRAIPSSWTRRLLVELLDSRGDAVWLLPGGCLRRHRGKVHWLQDAPGAALRSVLARQETGLSVQAAGVYTLPGWRGRLTVTPVARIGLPLSCLARIELRSRRGSERFQPDLSLPPRSLKKQFQAMAVPAWERDGPLVFVDGRLVFVPGLGLDARAVGRTDEALVDLRWEPDTAGGTALRPRNSAG